MNIFPEYNNDVLLILLAGLQKRKEHQRVTRVVTDHWQRSMQVIKSYWRKRRRIKRNP
jgi:hypothetical protein